VITITRSNEPDKLYQNKEKSEPVTPLIDSLNPKRKVSQQAQTVSYRKQEDRSTRPEKVPTPSRIEFYPVSYTGDPSEIAGGRVVRVELSRQALFAMGANIPLENGVENVKADLLIGPDGVTRAVRLARDF
jgi:hypothetical protein